MAETLKLIAKRIHWSLVLKAAVFGFVWFLLPFWLFLLLALYLYCVPWFETGKLFVPFFVLLILCLIQPQTGIFALVFAAVFYLILLLKDLLVIERRAAYELLALGLSFLLLRDFYLAFGSGVTGGAFLAAFFAAGAVALLVRTSLTAFSADVTFDPGKRSVALWLTFLLSFQALFVGLFLPLDFIYQLIIAFLAIVLLVDLVPEHLAYGVSRTKILTAATAISVLFVIILTSARWGL